jgi:hypothetical protein
MDTLVPVQILSKPLPTLNNPTSHHGNNQGVIPHNQGVPHTERTRTPWSPAETNRISVDGNPTLSTSVVVPGGLPHAIPVSVMPKSIQKDKTE